MAIVYIALILLTIAMLAQAIVIWHLRNKIDNLEEFASSVSFMLVNSKDKKIIVINKNEKEGD